jgi:hypothetical protein
LRALLRPRRMNLSVSTLAIAFFMTVPSVDERVHQRLGAARGDRQTVAHELP